MTIYQAVALAALGYLLGNAADVYDAAHPFYARHALLSSAVGAIGWTLVWVAPILVLVGVAR